MRLRNVVGASKIIEDSKYIILDYKEHKRKYSKVFKNKNPIHIEIGMGKGDFIIESAKRFPHINFIGIEKFDSVLVRAIQKLEDEQLDNLKIIKMDATNIDEVFACEIDLIYLNFSDPWPKARHEDRRLTSELFLEKYELLFKEEKTIIMKTDNRHLFEYSLKSFTDYGYAIKHLSLDMYKEVPSTNIPTEYENKFKDKGPIYLVHVNKNKKARNC